jgi:hypothetical protein
MWTTGKLPQTKRVGRSSVYVGGGRITIENPLEFISLPVGRQIAVSFASLPRGLEAMKRGLRARWWDSPAKLGI